MWNRPLTPAPRISLRALFHLIAVIAVGGPAAGLRAADSTPQMALAVKNSEPGRLPTLSVWTTDRHMMVAAEFPELPGNLFDAWCFEGPWVQYLGARELPGGRLELRHRYDLEVPVRIITTVTPERGGVEFLARMEKDPAAGGQWPGEVRPPNICWQVRRAPQFSSRPDPYPKFMERCFLFLESGRTFLHRTRRNIDQRRPPDDAKNSPPWIQRYLPAGAPEREMIALNTTDRYLAPIIGMISRDGRFLAALANGSATHVSQMWIDCLHNNPAWLPADAPLDERRWRHKYYFMKNDAAALLERANHDFPGSVPPKLLLRSLPE